MSLIDHLAPALLVVFRIGGLMLYAPVLSSSIIPARVRVLLAFALGVAVYPMLASSGVVDATPFSSLLLLAPLIALEVLLGVLIGFLASLPLGSLQFGGVIIGQQMGLGFAQLYNPAFDEESDVVAQLLYFMALCAFILFGGLDATVLTLLHTFERLPIGGVSQVFVSGEVIPLITGLMLSALELGIRVAAPLLCIVFLETVALGFLSKTVPQLNILSLGFPLRILVGLTILGLGATVINDVVIDEINAGVTAMTRWLDGSDVGPIRAR